MTNTLPAVVLAVLTNWLSTAQVDLTRTNLIATVSFSVSFPPPAPVVIPPVVVITNPPVVITNPPVVVIPPPVTNPPVVVIPPVVIPPPPPPPVAGDWFVAPDGKDSNLGTLASPRTLDWALAHPPEIKPGQTIWLRGGWYEGGSGNGQFRWINRLAGTPTHPITVRNWNNERATLHVYTNYTAVLNVGRWNRMIGLEFTCNSTVGVNHQSDQNLSIRPGGYAERGFSNVLANCVFHKMGNCIGQNSPVGGTNATYYGNIFSYNGWQYLNDGGSGTGYPMYVRNDSLGKGGPTVIKHNLFGPSFDFQVHSYGTGDRNGDVHAIQNAFWGAGNCSSNARTRGVWITAAGGVTSNFVFNGNAFYQEYLSPWEPFIVKHGQVNMAHGPNIYSTFTSNWFIGGGVNTWRAERHHTFTYNTMFHRHSFALIGGNGGPPPSARQDVTRNFNRYFSQRLASSVGLFTYRWNAAADPSADYNLTSWRATFGYDLDSTFEGVTSTINNVWVWPNEYEPNRAHVFVVNSTLSSQRNADNVTVNVRGIFQNGQVVKVRNVMNFYEPHAIRTVSADTISIPMTGLTMEPATVVAQSSGNRPFRVTDSMINGSVAGFVLTTW